MIIAIHQPNFIPWLPFFDKINKADTFVYLVHCNFEKNGFTNRCMVNDKWWTLPIRREHHSIKDKEYTNGERLFTVNSQWINAICLTLGIDTTKIRYDFETPSKGTSRIVQIVKHYGGTHYLTNPNAVDKYLDVEQLEANDIKLVPHEFNYKVHVFEAFDRWGIEGTRKLLAKEKERCKV